MRFKWKTLDCKEKVKEPHQKRANFSAINKIPIKIHKVFLQQTFLEHIMNLSEFQFDNILTCHNFSNIHKHKNSSFFFFFEINEIIFLNQTNPFYTFNFPNYKSSANCWKTQLCVCFLRSNICWFNCPNC